MKTNMLPMVLALLLALLGGCGDAEPTHDTHRQEFVESFTNGKLDGQAIINGNQAQVPFLFGPDGTAKEIMGLIQRDSQWYLYDF